MNAINARGVVFAIKTASTAIAAIAAALLLDLPNPGWAALTVFLTSQQFGAASGAVVARSVYRMLGTLLAVSGILFFVPALMVAPEMLVLGIAAWVAVCLYVSLLDRSPRGYVFLLAAYTLPLIGMPLANSPSSIFDVTMWRVEEIALGAALSMTVHTVFAPRSVRPLLLDKLRTAVGDARNWIQKGLAPDPVEAGEQRARNRLGTDLTEIRTLAALLGFEPGITSRDVSTVDALEARLLSLLPLLAGVEARLVALRRTDDQWGARIDAHLDAVRRHVEQPFARADADRLRASGRGLVAAAQRGLEDGELLAIAAMDRLDELLESWDECLVLLDRYEHPEHASDEGTHGPVPRPSPRLLHIDHGLAALSGLAAGLAVVLAGALCWVLGWDQGSAAMGIAAVGSSLFAFLDDPRPFVRLMLIATVMAVPVAALYVFAIFPALDGYVALACVLAPLLFVCALCLTVPKWAVPALGFVLITVTLMSVQPVQAGDFGSFMATAVGAVLGTSIALLVMSLVRVIGANTSVRRLMHATWRDLATIANGTDGLSRAAWASRMMDRVGLLQSRMAGANGVVRARAGRALDDLRIGVNMLDLRDAGLASRPEVRAAIEGALNQIGTHFRQRLVRPDAEAVPEISQALELAIVQLAGSETGAQRLRGLTAATGLRLGLTQQAAIVNGGAQ
ncbi:FUSC family protein [Variovorax sp. J2P1-59]|uniref:FUSC family protein n=1 Tax=Variovorax flavidus TaxID=3053501 RepID=UPI002574C342|nr:FUSC family protein [Variovorax sp. J2P1-59]MDM0078451.1 FUSC family protein [Variovorax sp. J2P1-59]